MFQAESDRMFAVLQEKLELIKAELAEDEERNRQLTTEKGWGRTMDSFIHYLLYWYLAPWIMMLFWVYSMLKLV